MNYRAAKELRAYVDDVAFAVVRSVYVTDAKPQKQDNRRRWALFGRPRARAKALALLTDQLHPRDVRRIKRMLGVSRSEGPGRFMAYLESAIDGALVRSKIEGAALKRPVAGRVRMVGQ